MVPALALADVLKDRGHQVAFSGTVRGMDRELILKAGYPHHQVRIRGFDRRLGLSTLRTLGSIPWAAFEAWKVLRATKPDCVVGVGAYASGPVVAEAALRGIPTMAVEMDARMGWTNRLLSVLVDKVCLAFPDERHVGSKYVYTGRPLRPALLTATRAEGLNRFGLASDRPVLLAFGGSLGAHALNVVVLEAYARAETPFQIVHVTGEMDYSWVVDTLAQPDANPLYQAHAFLDDFHLALAAADAVVSRAGGSVAEILARGVPALLVPYPYAAGDHQTKNARRLSESGAALMVANADLDANNLALAVTTLLDPRVNRRMKEAALKLAAPDATVHIADVVVELLARPARQHP